MVSHSSMRTDHYTVSRTPDSPGSAMRASASGQSYFDKYPERRGQGPYVPKARLTPSLKTSTSTSISATNPSPSPSPSTSAGTRACTGTSTNTSTSTGTGTGTGTSSATTTRERRSAADSSSPSTEKRWTRDGSGSSSSSQRKLQTHKSARNLAKAVSEDSTANADDGIVRPRAQSIQPEQSKHWHSRSSEAAAAAFPRFRGGLRAPETASEQPIQAGPSSSKARERLASEARTPSEKQQQTGDARVTAAAAASRSPSGYPSMLSSVAKRNSSQDLASQFRRQATLSQSDNPPPLPLKDSNVNATHRSGQVGLLSSSRLGSRYDDARMQRSASTGIVDGRLVAAKPGRPTQHDALDAFYSVPATHASSSHALGKARKPRLALDKTEKVPSIEEIIRKHSGSLQTPSPRSSTIHEGSHPWSVGQQHGATTVERSGNNGINHNDRSGYVDYDSDASFDSVIEEARAAWDPDRLKAKSRWAGRPQTASLADDDDEDEGEEGREGDSKQLPLCRKLQHATSFPAKPRMSTPSRRSTRDSHGRTRGASVTSGMTTTPPRTEGTPRVPPVPPSVTTPHLSTSAQAFSGYSAAAPSASSTAAATEEEQAISRYLRSPRLTKLMALQRAPYAGLTVSYADVGSPTGHPVIVFLGLGAVRYLVGLYDEMAAALDLRLICLDRWGLGRTDDIGSERRGVMEWSQVVIELADRLSLSRFSVLAHSAGAPYAMATCLLFGSERVAGPAHLLAPWVSASLESGYRWLKYVPDGLIRTAQAAESRVQGWRLGKLPALASTNNDVDDDNDDPWHRPSPSSNDYEAESADGTPRIDSYETPRRKPLPLLNLSTSSPVKSRSSPTANGVPDSASSPLLGSLSSTSPSPSSPSLSIGPSTRSSKSPIPRWPSSGSLRASSTPRSSIDPSSARLTLLLPDGTGVPSSASLSSFSNEEEDSSFDAATPASASVMGVDAGRRKRAWVLRRSTSSASPHAQKGGGPSLSYSQRHGPSAQSNGSGYSSSSSTAASTHSPLALRSGASNKSPPPTATPARVALASREAGDSSHDSVLQSPSSLKQREQGPSATGFDLATALLRASHAESQRGGGTADLLCILGRASQKPWGFTYADVNHAAKVWHGDKDERVSLGSVLWMERQMSNCRVELVKGAGHGLMTNVAVVVEALESIAACRHL